MPTRKKGRGKHKELKKTFNPTIKMSERQPLTYDDGPLVWVGHLALTAAPHPPYDVVHTDIAIDVKEAVLTTKIDCEMTGLEPTDCIIEIAVIITDGHLNEVDEGIEFVIQTPKERLDAMGEWCVNQHGKTGLTQACIDSPHTHEDVHQKVAAYIRKWIPERGAGLLAGSSVHADKAFLLREMPDITSHLSYRILDVSSIKEICRRWYPSITQKEKEVRRPEVSHRALDDIRGSMRELKFYRDNLFIPVEPQTAKKEKDASKSEASAERLVEKMKAL